MSFQHELTESLNLSEAGQDRLEKYYLLFWSGNYLLSKHSPGKKSQRAGDTLEHQGTSYKIRYHNCSAWQVVNNQDLQYRLSFRKPSRSETGYVLVSRGKY